MRLQFHLDDEEDERRRSRGRPRLSLRSLVENQGEKKKNTNCSAADDRRGRLLSEGNGGACRRMHETNHF